MELYLLLLLKSILPKGMADKKTLSEQDFCTKFITTDTRQQ